MPLPKSHDANCVFSLSCPYFLCASVSLWLISSEFEFIIPTHFAPCSRYFTDPESKIMTMSNEGRDQCGNAQAVVNENQIIVAAEMTDQVIEVPGGKRRKMLPIPCA